MPEEENEACPLRAPEEAVMVPDFSEDDGDEDDDEEGTAPTRGDFDDDLLPDSLKPKPGDDTLSVDFIITKAQLDRIEKLRALLPPSPTRTQQEEIAEEFSIAITKALIGAVEKFQPDFTKTIDDALTAYEKSKGL